MAQSITGATSTGENRGMSWNNSMFCHELINYAVRIVSIMETVVITGFSFVISSLINFFDTKFLVLYSCRHFVLDCFLFSHGPSFVSCLRCLACLTCCALLRAWDLPGLPSLIKRYPMPCQSCHCKDLRHETFSVKKANVIYINISLLPPLFRQEAIFGIFCVPRDVQTTSIYVSSRKLQRSHNWTFCLNKSLLRLETYQVYR